MYFIAYIVILSISVCVDLIDPKGKRSVTITPIQTMPDSSALVLLMNQTS